MPHLKLMIIYELLFPALWLWAQRSAPKTKPNPKIVSSISRDIPTSCKHLFGFFFMHLSNFIPLFSLIQDYFYPKYLGKFPFWHKPFISTRNSPIFRLSVCNHLIKCLPLCLSLACMDKFGDSEKKKQDLVTCVHSRFFFNTPLLICLSPSH